MRPPCPFHRVVATSEGPRDVDSRTRRAAKHYEVNCDGPGAPTTFLAAVAVMLCVLCPDVCCAQIPSAEEAFSGFRVVQHHQILAEYHRRQPKVLGGLNWAHPLSAMPEHRAINTIVCRPKTLAASSLPSADSVVCVCKACRGAQDGDCVADGGSVVQQEGAGSRGEREAEERWS